jgi:hypothetical protein
MKLWGSFFIYIGLLVLIASCSTKANDISPQKCAEITPRIIDEYRKIHAGMSFAEICNLVGQPDKEIGSGIYVYQYNLNDGTHVLIGFISLEKVYYVYHEEKNEQGKWKMIEEIIRTEK